MSSTENLFEVECQGDTVIVTPLTDLGEFNYQRLAEEAEEALQLLNRTTTDKKHVVVDFHKTDYFGSTALGLFVKLWKRVKSRDGHMAFCRVSAHEMDILKTTKLDSLWSICPSKEEAIKAVSG